MADEPVKLNSQELPQGNNESKNSSEPAAKAVPGIPFAKGPDPRRRNYGTPHFGPLFRAALKQMVTTKDGQQISAEEAIVRQAIAKAANGDVKFAQLIMDRTEGRPKQPIELGPDGAGTVPISEAEQARIENLFAFKREPVDLSKKQSKVEVWPIAKAPVPKTIGNVAQPIPPGRLVVAMPPASAPASKGSEQRIILKQNVKPKPNNSGQNKAA